LTTQETNLFFAPKDAEKQLQLIEIPSFLAEQEALKKAKQQR